MFGKWRARQAMFRQIYDEVRAREEKAKRLNMLVRNPLRYDIIREIINEAQMGVVIELTIDGGTKLVVKRQDTFDRKRADGVDF